MPHAALWVVQLDDVPKEYWDVKFQCRTRLCGWCSEACPWETKKGWVVSMPHAALWVVQRRILTLLVRLRGSFNAARGFVGGAASSLAALVPLREKSPFGKSRRCYAALRHIPTTFHFVLCTVYIIAETTPNDKCLPMQRGCCTKRKPSYSTPLALCRRCRCKHPFHRVLYFTSSAVGSIARPWNRLSPCPIVICAIFSSHFGSFV